MLASPVFHVQAGGDAVTTGGRRSQLQDKIYNEDRGKKWGSRRGARTSNLHSHTCMLTQIETLYMHACIHATSCLKIP